MTRLFFAIALTLGFSNISYASTEEDQTYQVYWVLITNDLPLYARNQYFSDSTNKY